MTAGSLCNVHSCLPAAKRIVHNDTHAPKLLGVKGHLGSILDPPTHLLLPGMITTAIASMAFVVLGFNLRPWPEPGSDRG